MITRIELEQALARGYCASVNAHKEVDSELIAAMADEVMVVIEAAIDLELAATEQKK